MGHLKMLSYLDRKGVMKMTSFFLSSLWKAKSRVRTESKTAARGLKPQGGGPQVGGSQVGGPQVGLWAYGRHNDLLLLTFSR